MSTPLPYDEKERLEELFSYGVLDTPAEPEFDRITRLAAKMLHAPVALITLIDRTRQWFKSHHGTDLLQTERCHAICAHTILEARVLVIPDIALDERFAHIPAALHLPHLRFYAGAPLLSPGGHRLGALCILDDRPRYLDEEQNALLVDFAALVVDALGLRQTRERARAELAVQGRIDQQILSLRDELEARVQQRTTRLIHSESRYRSIFENAVEGIYQTLPDGRFVNVNPAFAHILGYASPKALTETVADAAQLYVDAGRRGEFRHALDTAGVVSNWESELFRSNGARIWVTENTRAIRDADGVVLRYEGTMEDITTRKLTEEAIQHAHDELEDRVRARTAELALLNGTLRQQIAEREAAEASARRSESKFRALIENAQDLTTILTPDGTVLYQSPSAQHVLGSPVTNAVGVNVFERERLHPDDREPLRRMLGQFAVGHAQYVHIELRLRHLDGSWRRLESIGSLLPPDSPIQGIVLNSRDITERRRAELESQARTRQQTALAELGRCALEEPVLQTIFERAAGLVARALEVPFTTITEMTPGGAQLLIRAGIGWNEGVVGRELVENWRPLLPDGSRSEEPVVIDDLDAAPGCRLESFVTLQAQRPVSAASVVVRRDGALFGTLCAMAVEPGRFSPQDVTFLQTVADVLSTVIRSKHHETASREISARYQRIVANTPGMVYQAIQHADGTVSLPFISEGCRLLYDVEPAQMQAEPMLARRMVHPDDQAEYAAALAAAVRGTDRFNWEGRLLLPSGVVRWAAVRSRLERLRNGDLIIEGVVLDVSELKRAQDAMLLAKDEAERANAAKSEFLSRMSHELRTPLNAILGFGQLLGLERLTPMQTSGVEQILKGGHHLLNLINEILDITLIEAGGMEMKLESVDVASTLAEAVLFVAPLAEQHQVRFINRAARKDGLAVLADRSRLHQVLLNLLSNAVKYNRPDGQVRVGARRLGTQRVRLSIADTGLGIRPDQLDQLFMPFQRLDAPQLGIEGSGIGLAITKSLVEAMGGSIGVESAPRRGSTFFVDLPVAVPLSESAAPGAAPGAAGPASAPPGVRTVLHVDDHSANRSLVERVLENRPGLRLLAAADGRGGLALARDHRPDVILLDLHLPDLTGDEVVRRLRAEPRTGAIPVVVLSADATPAQVARLRSLGVQRYLTKPFRIQELLEAIDTTLQPAQPVS